MYNDTSELISLITVEYGKELMLFKSAVLEEFDISLLLNKKFHLVVLYQEQLFDIVMKYSHLLRYTKENQKITFKSHPNNYALMIAMISELTLCDSWEHLLKQTKKYRFKYNDFDFTLKNLDDERNCCCRHVCKIKNLFLMTNIITKLSVYTGCECIKKMILTSMESDGIKDKLKEINNTRACNASYENALKKDKERKKKIEELYKENSLKNIIFQSLRTNRSKQIWTKIRIVRHWQRIIHARNNLRKKVIKFILTTVKDKVDFLRIVCEIGVVSWYKFAIKYGITLKWRKYIEWILDQKTISQVKKNKILKCLSCISQVRTKK